MKRYLPPFNYIVVADAVYRNGSFKDAATSLSVTPSAVSHQIRILEDWLGFELFDRTKKSIRTTPLGQKFLERVETSLTEIEHATHDVHQVRGLNKPIRVQTTDSFARMVLIEKVAPTQTTDMATNHRAHIRISTSEFTTPFNEHDADIGVISGDGKCDKYKILHSFIENILPVCSPSLLNGASAIPVASILGMPLITDYLLGTSWHHWCRFMGYMPSSTETTHINNALQVNHSHLAIEAAINGQGVTLASDILTRDTIKKGQLQALTHEKLKTENGYHIVCAPDTPNRRITEFADWLATQIRQ